MTHVDWHPVKVTRDGIIVKGEIPPIGEDVFVTEDGEVHIEIYNEDFGFGWEYSLWSADIRPYKADITAWAYINLPEPYQPEAKDE